MVLKVSIIYVDQMHICIHFAVSLTLYQLPLQWIQKLKSKKVVWDSKFCTNCESVHTIKWSSALYQPNCGWNNFLAKNRLSFDLCKLKINECLTKCSVIVLINGAFPLHLSHFCGFWLDGRHWNWNSTKYQLHVYLQWSATIISVVHTVLFFFVIVFSFFQLFFHLWNCVECWLWVALSQKIVNIIAKFASKFTSRKGFIHLLSQFLTKNSFCYVKPLICATF